MQEAENKEINDVILDNEHDSCFALWKPKILEAIDHVKTIRHKRADINAIFDYINKNATSNINKNVIENFISQLTKQKIIINKKTPAGCDSFCLTKKDNHEIVSEEIPKSPVISNEIDTPDCTSTEPVIEKEEDQLNHLRRQFSKHEGQFAALKSFMMDELLEVKNNIESLNSEQNKNCCTNLKDEIKLLREEISSKNLIIKILAENRYNSGNNESSNSPYRCGNCRCCNFQNLNSRCSDRLNSPLQNDVVNLKKPVKEGNDIDFQISTSNRFNHLTVDEPSREEVGQVGQLHTANHQNKKSVLPPKNLNRRPPIVINKKPENQLSES